MDKAKQDLKLDFPLEEIFRLNPSQKKALKKLGIETAEDLLFHFPTRYGNVSEVRNIAGLEKGEEVTVFGKIKNLKTGKGFKSKIPRAEATIEDETGKIKAMWFNQPYIAKMIGEESLVRVEGKVSERQKTKELYFSNPKIEKVGKLPTGVGDSLFGEEGKNHHLHPVYPESRGVTSNWFFHAIQKLFKNGVLNEVIDPIPQEILERYKLPSLKTALIWIHAPQKEDHGLSARKRFAFQEIFFIQLEKQRERKNYEKLPSFKIDRPVKEIKNFIDKFPFKPTKAQEKAIANILSDFKKDRAMSRLLEGDVGSGKTFVAAITAYAVVTTHPPSSLSSGGFGNLQVAYMAPTEILAEQHFQSFIEHFKHLNINVGLITGSGCKKFPSKTRNYAEHTRKNAERVTSISKSQLLKWVANGEIPILIGTHALIQKSVQFKNLGYIIIDEQHRFGVRQRQALARGQTRNERGTNPSSRAKLTTGHSAEQKPPIDPLIYRDLTYRIRNALFDVKKNLGGGHKEVIYQRAVSEALEKAKLDFSREVQIPITYNKKKVGVYVPDFVIEDKIILELKAQSFVGATEKKQVWGYLKGSRYHLALLVNFGPRELTVDRIVYDKARISASVPHSSASLPHLLSMTATPIPRTLALTIFGDLDLTLLDEMPHGRKPIITEIVLPDGREKVYEEIKKELQAGRQMYVICPRIDLPDPDKALALNVKSVKEEAKRLKKKVFPDYQIEILHSKMKSSEKEKTMLDFKDSKIDILVSTSVVEVGVNVPNSTVIVIEGAERFGLSQLHQLRGRVLRSNHQAYCYVFSDSKTKKSLERLKALKTAKNGFELAEFDLKQRGAGDLYGRKQWGVSDLAMEALKNIKMVEAARKEAERIIESDPELESLPEIKEVISRKQKEIHFE